MEYSVYQRLMSILENKQLSVNALSKIIGMSQTTLNTQLKGERTLAASVVEKFLLSFPDVSAEWVMRGTGSMYLDQTKTNVTEVTSESNQSTKDDSLWQAKYEELEKRYDQLLSIIGSRIVK